MVGRGPPLPGRLFDGGTDGSNPASSSGESANYRFRYRADPALAGAIQEVTEHVVVLVRAGIDEIIIRPFAPEGGTIEETIASFASRVWPQVMSSIG